MEKQSLLEEWPKIRFDAIEKIEIESNSLKLFYRTFFITIGIPGFLIRSVFVALKETLIR